MPLKVRNERELRKFLKTSHRRQAEDMPEGDVIKDLLNRVGKLERQIKSQAKRIKALEAREGKMWKLYGEVQRSGLLAPDGGEEGF